MVYFGFAQAVGGGSGSPGKRSGKWSP